MRAYLVTADLPDGSALKGQTVRLPDAKALRLLASRHVALLVRQPDPLQQQRKRLNAAVTQRRCCF